MSNEDGGGDLVRVVTPEDQVKAVMSWLMAGGTLAVSLGLSAEYWTLISSWIAKLALLAIPVLHIISLFLPKGQLAWRKITPVASPTEARRGRKLT